MRQRVASAALALGLVAALLLALFTLGALPDLRSDAEAIMATFDVAPPAPKSAGAAPKRAVAKAEPKRTLPPPPPTATPPPLPLRPFALPGVIPLTREQYAAADIGKMPSADTGAPVASGTAEAGGTGGVGIAPDGSTLFAADWQREPTDAEISTYMPKRARSGWGLIICRTAPRNRVTDCRILEETPGSGIARGMREAAWQFLVLPPRVDGQPVIGAWVRIRFDLNRGVTR